MSSHIGILPRTCKSIWVRYQAEGVSSLECHYSNSGRLRLYDIKYERLSKWLKRKMPLWGAGRIRVHLVAKYGADAVPRLRLIQRWTAAEVPIESGMRRTQPSIGKSTACHNIWQVDAKEQLCLADGSVVCYLTFTDEHSGGWLGSIVFEYARICQVPVSIVRSACTEMFEKWGKAGSFRVDNGEPLGAAKRDHISALGLWLTAIGVKMIWNTPRKPTENAKVERTQRVSKNWVNIAQCANKAVLQTALDREARVHIWDFPVKRLQYQTRLAAFPTLTTKPRVYDTAYFDAHLAHQLIAQQVYLRKISANGVFQLFGQIYNIGRAHRKETASIRLKIDALEWEAYVGDKSIKTFTASNLSTQHIQNLTVFQNQKTNTDAPLQKKPDAQERT